MKVELRRDFFGPNGVRYRRGIVDYPDNLKDYLPSDAKEVDEDVPLRRASESLVKPQLPKAATKPAVKVTPAAKGTVAKVEATAKDEE